MHESAPSTNISLFSYLEFRDYLSDWFDAKKKENRRYSHRLFARQIGQKSPSFLSDVIKGRRRLTVKTAMAVAQALGLNKTERRYFQLLVTLQQSDEDETKDKIMREVLALRKRFGAITSLEGEAFEVLSQWEYTAVYELLKRPDFRLDPVWIGKAIQPPISSRKARSVVETLFAVGLLVKDERGRLRTRTAELSTPPSVEGLAVRHYHRNMLQLAQESMQRFPSARRHLIGVTTAIPSSKIPELKRRLEGAMQDLHLFCEEGEDNKDEVIQLNMNFFPLSTPRKKMT